MYDVIIVGGGIAGCHLASKLSGRHKVLLIERKKDIVPKDSGIVSVRYDEVFGKRGERFVSSEITKMDCISPAGKTFSLHSETPYAYILHRERFAAFLRKNARERAEIIYDGVREVKRLKDSVVVKTEHSGEFTARMVAGCDGANSVVRNSLGIERPNTSLGIMVRTKKRLEGNISVYFNKYYSPDFFSWVIPQNNEYGLMTSVRPADYFKYFVREMFLPEGKMYAYQIPYTYTKSYADRAVLVGDSCGQNKPLTGGGIMFSMIAAEHAARVMNDALSENRLDKHFLGFYERYWKKELAWEIEKQYMLRMIYRKLTNKEIDEVVEKFGPLLSSLNGFDYDRLTGMWKDIPKLKMFKFLMAKTPRLIGF